MAATLEARDLYRFYHAGDEETLALRGVSLSVDGGEVVAVVGPSGSGKSTLLACLAGLDEPDGGTVHVDGERLSRRPEQERARVRARSIGVLFQSANLLGHLDVRQNALLAQRLAGRVATARVQELFASAGIQGRAGALPTQLSGGELARAGLVVALANDPPLLLADEPTGELDSDSAARIIALIRQRAAGGTAVVVVTHNEELAATAERLIELHDGSVVA